MHLQELITGAREVTQFLGDAGLQRITLETDRQLFQLSPLGSGGWSLAAVPKSGSRAGTADPPPSLTTNL